MIVKQMLFNLYGQKNSKLNVGQTQRKNINYGRNKQKLKFIEENNKISKTCSWLQPSAQQINAITLKYLESHHPSIKRRVVKIVANHQQDRSYRQYNKMNKYSLFDNEELKLRSKTIHSQKSSIYQFDPQQRNQDKKMYQSIIQISKPCKISIKQLTKRSQTEQKQSKNRQCNCETKRVKAIPRKLRVQTANIYNRMPLKSNSFTAWQIDISTNGSFLPS